MGSTEPTSETRYSAENPPSVSGLGRLEKVTGTLAQTSIRLPARRAGLKRRSFAPETAAESKAANPEDSSTSTLSTAPVSETRTRRSVSPSMS